MRFPVRIPYRGGPSSKRLKQEKGNPAAIRVPVELSHGAEVWADVIQTISSRGFFPRYFTEIPMLYLTAGAVPEVFVRTVRSFPADIIP